MEREKKIAQIYQIPYYRTALMEYSSLLSLTLTLALPYYLKLFLKHAFKVLYKLSLTHIHMYTHMHICIHIRGSPLSYYPLAYTVYMLKILFIPIAHIHIYTYLYTYIYTHVTISMLTSFINRSFSLFALRASSAWLTKGENTLTFSDLEEECLLEKMRLL